MSEPLTFGVEVEQREGFEFRVRFDWPQVPELVLDEPEPLGRARGPNAARLVGAAVANCGRYRIAGIDVVLSLSEALGEMPHQQRCLEQFEDFCVVTESVRRGIPVAVTVVDATGKVVHETTSPALLE